MYLFLGTSGIQNQCNNHTVQSQHFREDQDKHDTHKEPRLMHEFTHSNIPNNTNRIPTTQTRKSNT